MPRCWRCYYKTTSENLTRFKIRSATFINICSECLEVTRLELQPNYLPKFPCWLWDDDFNCQIFTNWLELNDWYQPEIDKTDWNFGFYQREQPIPAQLRRLVEGYSPSQEEVVKLLQENFNKSPRGNGLFVHVYWLASHSILLCVKNYPDFQEQLDQYLDFYPQFKRIPYLVTLDSTIFQDLKFSRDYHQFTLEYTHSLHSRQEWTLPKETLEAQLISLNRLRRKLDQQEQFIRDYQSSDDGWIHLVV